MCNMQINRQTPRVLRLNRRGVCAGVPGVASNAAKGIYYPGLRVFLQLYKKNAPRRGLVDGAGR